MLCAAAAAVAADHRAWRVLMRRTPGILAATLAMLALAAIPAATLAAGAATTIPVRIATCDPAPRPFDAERIDLTGTWSADDGGIYYIRQVDQDVWWTGMDGLGGPVDLLGRGWTNVASGTLGEDGRLPLEWADTPRGSDLGGGELLVQVEANAGGFITIRKIGDTGGFGGRLWLPCAITGPADATAVLPPDGTYTATITPEDFVAAGGDPDDAPLLSGTISWTFADGAFAITGPGIAEGACIGTHESVGEAVRLRFADLEVCWGVDDVLVTLDGDDLAIAWLGCGDGDCNPPTDRAWFERTWARAD
jgi:hypothetical protein